LTRFPNYVILIHQRYRLTDRQADRRRAIARPRALHNSKSRGKKVSKRPAVGAYHARRNSNFCLIH